MAMNRALRAYAAMGSSLVLLIAAATTGCSSHHAPPLLPIAYDAGSASAAPVLRTDTCASEGFRAIGEPGQVVCPGTSTCACGQDQVCCLPTIDTSMPGTCQSLGDCRTTALQCAGPEGCRSSGPDGGAGVCCLDEGPGGGTSCEATAWECYSHQVVCHADTDCLVVAPSFPFCRPSNFGTAGVADKSLDGLLGICSSM
jgi:hypothetical protein